MSVPALETSLGPDILCDFMMGGGAAHVTKKIPFLAVARVRNLCGPLDGRDIPLDRGRPRVYRDTRRQGEKSQKKMYINYTGCGLGSFGQQLQGAGRALTGVVGPK